MTPEERRELDLHSIETDLALLDRIASLGQKIREEGRTPPTSDEWIAFHRAQAEKRLARLRRRDAA